MQIYINLNPVDMIIGKVIITYEVKKMDFPLTWDDSYEIALELHRIHPHISINDVSIEMIYKWTISLPRFNDEIELVNEDILQDIFREWLEEVISNE